MVLLFSLELEVWRHYFLRFNSLGLFWLPFFVIDTCSNHLFMYDWLQIIALKHCLTFFDQPSFGDLCWTKKVIENHSLSSTLSHFINFFANLKHSEVIRATPQLLQYSARLTSNGLGLYRGGFSQASQDSISNLDFTILSFTIVDDLLVCNRKESRILAK